MFLFNLMKFYKMFFGHYFAFHGSNYNELTNKTRYTFLKNKFMYKHFNKKCSYNQISFEIQNSLSQSNSS